MYEAPSEYKQCFVVKDSELYLLEGFTFDDDMSMQEAFQRAIAKWEIIVDTFAKGLSFTTAGGVSTCALCAKVAYFCKNCPIAQSTGGGGCKETPNYEFELEPSELHARRELAFLRGLYTGLFGGGDS